MPEVRVARSVDVPLAAVWAFVQDLDRWAPLVEGYVAHARHDDRRSTWTLRGDLGPFSREVRCDVTITEWSPARVAFELEGVDEPVTARGTFDLGTSERALPAPLPRPWWRRLLDVLLRRGLPAPPTPAQSHVVFTFAVRAGGAMGPMIDALLGPWSELVAQRLLDRVAERLASPEVAA